MIEVLLDKMLLYAGLIIVNFVINLVLIPIFFRGRASPTPPRRRMLLIALIVAVFVSVIEAAFFTGE